MLSQLSNRQVEDKQCFFLGEGRGKVLEVNSGGVIKHPFDENLKSCLFGSDRSFLYQNNMVVHPIGLNTSRQ